MELDNCEVKHSRQGYRYDILLKSSTVIGTSTRKIDIHSVKFNESQTITLSTIASKKQCAKVNVNIKVTEVGEPDEVNKKVYKDIIVADQASSSKLILSEKQSLEKSCRLTYFFENYNS